MITVKAKKEGTYYKDISIKGHAMYDDFGKDIVCSAVSSIVITTVNAILLLKEKSITYNQDNDGLKIKVIRHDKTVNTLICNMISLLEELADNYKENVEVSKEE